MHVCSLDTETFSKVDIRKAGAVKYAENSELLLFGYALDNDRAKMYDVAKAVNDPQYRYAPDDLMASLTDPSVVLMAHNVLFDRHVLIHHFRRDKNLVKIIANLERWVDNQAKLLSVGIQPGLGDAGNALGLSESDAKIKDGRRLIMKFCKPQRKNSSRERVYPDDAPGDWELFIKYCLQDVETMRLIWKMIPSWNYGKPDQQEMKIWRLDQAINDDGFKVDTDLARGVLRASDAEKIKLADRAREITFNRVGNTTQAMRTVAYVNSRGVKMTNCTKADVINVLATPGIPDDVRELLTLRQTASQTSVAKFNKALAVACNDDRVRGGYQYCGAFRSGRWAGRMLQPHNFKRPGMNNADIDQAVSTFKSDNAVTILPLLYDSAISTATHCIRAMVIPEPGYHFVVGDYANVEGRKTAWFAQEKWKLQAYIDYDNGVGQDLYKLSYANAFNVPIESIGDDSRERQIGKVMELALNFQGGPGAFANMAQGFGVDIDPELAKTIVKKWRAAHPKITKLWSNLESCTMSAIKSPNTGFTTNNLHFIVKTFGAHTWLLMRLPSGRYLCYFDPKIERHHQFDKDVVSYMGVDQYTRKWERIQTYGGKTTENAVQASSRCLEARALLNVAGRSAKTVMHTHDELVVETDGAYTQAMLTHDMLDQEEWAHGLPLAVKTQRMVRYGK